MTDTINQNRKRTVGYVMAGAGCLMILANALDFALGWEANLIPLFIIGIALASVGMSLFKNG